LFVSEKTVEIVMVGFAVVDEGVSETVDGLNFMVGDDEPLGETVAENDTLPVNPSRP
jgi:hypothetical protein